MENEKVILITGSSSGIGLETSVYLAKKGFKVYASMRDLKKKDPLLSRAKESGALLETIQIDVTDENSINNAVKFILEKEGRIDVLINNAGFGSAGFLEDYSIEEIKGVYETNFFGLIRMTQAILPAMRNRKKGLIINISSIGGKISFPAISIYNSSKFAVESITESLRIELRSFGIKATSVEPLSIKTNFYNSARSAKKSEQESSPYFHLFRNFKKNIVKMNSNAIDAEKAGEAIYKIINTKNPKRNYFVGPGARAFWLLKLLLPNSIFEKIIHKVFLG